MNSTLSFRIDQRKVVHAMNIAEKLQDIITTLDAKTTEKVESEYGLDIASRVEHISKQIEKLPDGGGSSGGGSGVFPFNALWMAGTDSITLDHTYAEFKAAHDKGQIFICSNTLCSASMTNDESDPSAEPSVTILISAVTLTSFCVAGFIFKPDGTFGKQFEAVINIDEMKIPN